MVEEAAALARCCRRTARELFKVEVTLNSGAYK